MTKKAFLRFVLALAGVAVATGAQAQPYAVTPGELQIQRDGSVFKISSHLLNGPQSSCDFIAGIGVVDVSSGDFFWIASLGLLQQDGSLDVEREHALSVLASNSAKWIWVSTTCGTNDAEFGAQAFRHWLEPLDDGERTFIPIHYNVNLAQGTKVTALDGTESSWFGYSVAATDATFVVGALDGSAHVFEHNGNTWTQVARLTASDGAGGFGHSTAVSQGLLVVGQANLVSSGSAYVFDRVGGAWLQTAKLTALPGEPFDNFGMSVAVAQDTIVVGAPTDHHGGAFFGGGAAYIFERAWGTWELVTKLTEASPGYIHNFGDSVAISETTIAIGAPGSRAVYVLERDGSGWQEVATLMASDGIALRFGEAVAISGNTIAVGASQSDATYVFERQGNEWQEVAKLTASDGFPGQGFGEAIGAGPDSIVVGAAPFDALGAAYVFKRSSGGWREVAKLTANDGAPGDGFGMAVGVGPSVVVVGAPLRDDNGVDSGAVYVFH